MATLFRINHSDGTSVIINIDQVTRIKREGTKLSFFMNTEKYEVVYQEEENAKTTFDKIFDLTEYIVKDYEEDEDEDDDDENDNYSKPNKEAILSERIDQLLDLLSKKDKEIKELKNEKKGFINKIKGLI